MGPRWQMNDFGSKFIFDDIDHERRAKVAIRNPITFELLFHHRGTDITDMEKMFKDYDNLPNEFRSINCCECNAMSEANDEDPRLQESEISDYRIRSPQGRSGSDFRQYHTRNGGRSPGHDDDPPQW